MLLSLLLIGYDVQLAIKRYLRLATFHGLRLSVPMGLFIAPKASKHSSGETDVEANGSVSIGKRTRRSCDE